MLTLVATHKVILSLTWLPLSMELIQGSPSLPQVLLCQDWTGMEYPCMGLYLVSQQILSLYLGNHHTCSLDINSSSNHNNNSNLLVNHSK